VIRLTLLLATLLAPGTGRVPVPPTGEALIARMHQRYAGKWYRTLTFVQTTTLPDGRVETWYEALSTPGKLRIDIAPLDSMHALLFRNDSVYEIRGGKVVHAKPQIHPLMVLGFDVYAQPVAETIRKLQTLKFDLTKVHETTWEGRATYVVGAEAGDTTSPQFWIDKERLYFVRSLEPAPNKPEVTLDTRFGAYRPMGGGWVEMEVVFRANGKVRGKEEYADPEADVTLDPALFEPAPWTPPAWISARQQK
jgi:hypothetical protein